MNLKRNGMKALALVTVLTMVLALVPGISFAAGVSPELQAAVDALVIHNADDIRGSITLPSVGENGAAIVWTSSDEAVVSTEEIENEGYIPTPPGHVTRGGEDVNVTLTAAISLNGQTAEKTFDLTVKALPAKGVSIMSAESDNYLMYYFKGDYYDGSRNPNERIWIAGSEDGLHWSTLNNDQPILQSTLGEEGLRDPYLVSNAAGDKFYLIATDLLVAGRGWNYGTSHEGSKSIMVWESTDLIHWGDQRMMTVSTDDMGCTWAPEAAYDATRDIFVVYWAARDMTRDDNIFSVFYSETADFINFTEPKPFVVRDPFSGNDMDNVIDTTILYVEGEGYYRFTKNENEGTNDSKRVFLEHADELLGTYEPIKTNIYDEQQGVEGPEIYQLPDGQFCLILDRYTAGGYFPFVSDSLMPAEGSDSITMTGLTSDTYKFPPSPRHGTVVRVSDEIYKAVVENYTSPAKVVEADAEGAGPILRYDFEDGTAKDSIGGNDGKLFGNATVVEDAEKGKVLSLDGNKVSLNGAANTYLEIPKGLLDGRNELTVSMDICNYTTGNFFTFALGQSEHRYLFTRVRNDGVYAAITTASNGGEQGATAANTVTDGKWSNVTITISAADHSMKIYTNGLLTAENKNLTLSVADLRTDLRAYIGKSLWFADGYAKMKVDNVEIYNRVLSSNEIREKYTEPVTAYSVTVDADKKGADITEGMIGLFFEDINYSGDGGLYSEVVNNRSFEAYDARNNQTNPTPIPGYGWSVVGGAAADYKSEGEPLNSNNKTYLTLTAAAAGDGIENDCYSGDGNNNRPESKGMNAVQGDGYNASLYVRGDYDGTVTLQVVDGNTVLGEMEFDDITADFTKKEGVIKLIGSSDDARVRVILSKPGTVELDMISLIPQQTFNGRDNGLRADLVELLAELHPGFLRFPGGCIIEGFNLANRYQWKHTVGPVEQRIQNWSRWQTHNETHHGNGMYGYCQTYGLGFYEYFLLCEDLGAKAVPVVNVGLACQYQSKENSSKEDLYNIYIPDALDLIEFANGTPDADWADIDYSKVNSTDPETFGNNWANLRALMGHPESFELEYVGIGNEQFDTSDYSTTDADGWANNGNNFFARYEAFEKAIHELYPDMKLISTSGPSSDDAGDSSGNQGAFSKAWNWVNEHVAENPSFTYAVDEHYYKQPDWPYANVNRYDMYDRNGAAVFAGEYAFRWWSAAYDNNPIVPRGNTWEAALSEAAYMTGLERNSDIVKMASYAPLFAKEGSVQWTPDMIWFNNTESYGSPDYYVQQLYSRNSGDYNLKTKVGDKSDNGAYEGIVGVGTWLTAASFSDLKIVNDDTGEVIPANGWQNTTEGDFASAGSWTVNEDGSVAQASTSSANGTYLFADMEPITADNYTITLKATKTGGAEGFTIPIMAKDKNTLIHWNVGGWGNTASSFEARTNGANGRVGDYVGTVLETNREYEIKIVVKNGTIYGYLDGKLINTYLFDSNPVYANAIKDEATGDVILKLVNSSSNNMELPININGGAELTGYATEYSMVGDFAGKNDFDDPERIAPVRSEIELASGDTYPLPAYSFVVLRFHTKDTVGVAEVDEAEYEVRKGQKLELAPDVNVHLAGGGSEKRSVQWILPDAGVFANAGSFKVYGRVEGTELDAVAKVTVTDFNEGDVIEVDSEALKSGVKTEIVFQPEKAGWYRGILAVYGENGLESIHSISFTGSYAVMKAQLAEEFEGKEIKIMLWTEDTLVPVTDAVKVK